MTAIRISLSFKVAPVIKSSGRFKAWTRKIDLRRYKRFRKVREKR